MDAAGVVEAAVTAMRVPPDQLLAWLGPAIGPTAFEVGDDVRDAFADDNPGDVRHFAPGVRPGKWLADLPQLARRRLATAGVDAVSGAPRCTVGEPAAFFSYRRERVTGRMATLIWLEV